MKLPRRRFLHLAASALALPALSRMAMAQAYPTRPVRLIVGNAAGGVQDILARLVGQWLSERLGQPVVVDNRPGVGGNLATEAVVKATPDGHTLLMIAPLHAIGAAFYEKLNYNFIRDIAPVASIMHPPEVMVVHPSVPAKTVPEFIAYAKANPGKMNVASAGNGTGPHMAGELFKIMADIDMLHVPYRGGGPAALIDLLAGQVHVMFFAPVLLIDHVRTGKLRALAVTTAARSDALPSLPTVGEFLPGYEAGGWFGIGAPKNTPAAIIDKLNKEINAGLADPTMRARLFDLGGGVAANSPAEFASIISHETEKWAKVVKFTGTKPD